MRFIPFGKDWEKDILEIPKEEMFILFKSMCVRLICTEKDLKEAKKQISEYELIIKNNKK
jgi:hypothetical protein